MLYLPHLSHFKQLTYTILSNYGYIVCMGLIHKQNDIVIDLDMTGIRLNGLYLNYNYECVELFPLWK